MELLHHTAGTAHNCYEILELQNTSIEVDNHIHSERLLTKFGRKINLNLNYI